MLLKLSAFCCHQEGACLFEMINLKVSQTLNCNEFSHYLLNRQDAKAPRVGRLCVSPNLLA